MDHSSFCFFFNFLNVRKEPKRHKKKLKTLSRVLGNMQCNLANHVTCSLNNHCRFPPSLRSKRVNVNDLVNLSGNDRETESIPDKYLIQSESYRNSLIINPKTQQSLWPLGILMHIYWTKAVNFLWKCMVSGRRQHKSNNGLFSLYKIKFLSGFWH